MALGFSNFFGLFKGIKFWKRPKRRHTNRKKENERILDAFDVLRLPHSIGRKFTRNILQSWNHFKCSAFQSCSLILSEANGLKQCTLADFGIHIMALIAQGTKAPKYLKNIRKGNFPIGSRFRCRCCCCCSCCHRLCVSIVRKQKPRFSLESIW